MAKLIVVDVEADGPVPGPWSMVCFGAIIVEPGLTRTFYAGTKPISEKWIPEALAISGFSREEHEQFSDPVDAMKRFADWIKAETNNKAIFISDNLAFDWMFIAYYMWVYYGSNPFGFSGQRIGDKFQGFFNDPYYKWKKHRSTSHTHNPVDDAKGNAEALLYLKSTGFKLQL